MSNVVDGTEPPRTVAVKNSGIGYFKGTRTGVPIAPSWPSSTRRFSDTAFPEASRRKRNRRRKAGRPELHEIGLGPGTSLAPPSSAFNRTCRLTTLPACTIAYPSEVDCFSLGKNSLRNRTSSAPFDPEDVDAAVGGQPEIPRGHPAAGLVPAGNLDPGVELAGGDVVRPCVEQPAEIVVPLLASQSELGVAPFLVRFDDVADTAEVDSPAVEHHIGIADTDRLRPVVLGSPWIDEFAVCGTRDPCRRRRPIRNGCGRYSGKE